MREHTGIVRQLRLVLGCLILLLGWTGAFLIGQLPPGTPILWLFPTLLLGGGLGLMVKTARWPPTVFAAALTAFLALHLSSIAQQRGWTVHLLSINVPEKYAHLSPMILKVPQELRKGRYKITRAFYGLHGWSISLYARVEGHPRMLAFDKSGNLFVSLPESGELVGIPAGETVGQRTPFVVADGLDRPYGVVWAPQGLYVAGTTTLYKIQPGGQNGKAVVSQVYSGLPDAGGHWARTLTLDSRNRLVMGLGSSCNACRENNPMLGTLVTIEPETPELSVLARGIRYAGGLAMTPDGKIWAAESGRTFPKGLSAPDEINQIIVGGDYGWPGCYGDRKPDPTWGTGERCQGTLPPIHELPGGSHPRGMAAFGAGDVPGLPGEGLILVLGGQDTHYRGTEGRLIMVTDQAGGRVQKDLLAGWVFNGVAWAKPVDAAIGPDGALYLSDMRNGGIYRLAKEK